MKRDLKIFKNPVLTVKNHIAIMKLNCNSKVGCINNPFTIIKDFLLSNEKMDVYKKAQKKYDESMGVYFTPKSKVKGSNSISTEGNYNIYVSGIGREY